MIFQKNFDEKLIENNINDRCKLLQYNELY